MNRPFRKSSLLVAVFGIAIAAMLGSPAAAQNVALCPPASDADIARLSDGWAKAIAGGRASEAASYYAEDAVLLAEGMAEQIKGRAQIGSYIAALAARHAEPRADMRNIMIRCNVANEMSATRIQVTGKRKGTRMFIGGRANTVWMHNGSSWLIAQQSLPTMSVPNRVR